MNPQFLSDSVTFTEKFTHLLRFLYSVSRNNGVVCVSGLYGTDFCACIIDFI